MGVLDIVTLMVHLDGKSYTHLIIRLMMGWSDLIGKGIKAGDLVREMGKTTGGGGGGAPHLAQAGGRDASKLDEALALVPSLIETGVG